MGGCLRMILISVVGGWVMKKVSERFAGRGTQRDDEHASAAGGRGDPGAYGG